MIDTPHSLTTIFCFLIDENSENQHHAILKSQTPEVSHTSQ